MDATGYPRARRDGDATGDGSCAIQLADSTIEVWVIPTDEGRVAARLALQLCRLL